MQKAPSLGVPRTIVGAFDDPHWVTVVTQLPKSATTTSH
jgi:hypothetical protein